MPLLTQGIRKSGAIGFLHILFRSPSRTVVLGSSSPPSKTEMFDDQAFARKAHRRPQRQIPQSLVTGGRTYMTAGVNGKGPEFVAKALAKVTALNDFTGRSTRM